MNYRISALAMGVVMAAAASANIYSNKSTDTGVPALNPSAVSDSGVAAPAGGFWSEVENDAGNTTESNTVGGFTIRESVVGSGDFFRVADDFTVTNGIMVVTALKGYAYHSGASSATQPFTGGSVNLLSADPTASPTTLGTGNVVTSSYAVPVGRSAGTVVTGNVFRCFNTQYPTGTAPGTTRQLQEGRIALNSPVSLAAGTYWVDYQFNINPGGTALSCFGPSTTHDESRSAPGTSNAFQKTTATGWVALIDAGNPAAAPDVPQDLPFMLEGHVIRFADSFNIVQGQPFGGSVDDLDASDDVKVFILCDESNPNSEIRFVFNTTITRTSTMEVRIESSSARNDQTQFFAIFNPTTSAWVPAGSQVSSLTDVVFTANISAAQQFVGGAGNVGFRAVVIPNADLEAADGWSNQYDLFNARCNP